MWHHNISCTRIWTYFLFGYSCIWLTDTISIDCCWKHVWTMTPTCISLYLHFDTINLHLIEDCCVLVIKWAVWERFPNVIIENSWVHVFCFRERLLCTVFEHDCCGITLFCGWAILSIIARSIRDVTRLWCVFWLLIVEDVGHSVCGCGYLWINIANHPGVDR